MSRSHLKSNIIGLSLLLASTSFAMAQSKDFVWDPSTGKTNSETETHDTAPTPTCAPQSSPFLISTTDCSATCGGGTQTQTWSNGCPDGTSTQEIACNTQACDVKGTIYFTASAAKHQSKWDYKLILFGNGWARANIAEPDLIFPESFSDIYYNNADPHVVALKDGVDEYFFVNDSFWQDKIMNENDSLKRTWLNVPSNNLQSYSMSTQNIRVHQSGVCPLPTRDGTWYMNVGETIVIPKFLGYFCGMRGTSEAMYAKFTCRDDTTFDVSMAHTWFYQHSYFDPSLQWTNMGNHVLQNGWVRDWIMQIWRVPVQCTGCRPEYMMTRPFDLAPASVD